jgi:predicted heme/steroid binding protein
MLFDLDSIRFQRVYYRWVVINDTVYDLSKFYALHPGGDEVLREYYGKDATEAFYGLHRQEVLEKYGPRLMVGRIEGASNPPIKMETYADISAVPFAEIPFFRGELSPVWRPKHLEFRKLVRQWVHENLREDAERCELSGESPSDEVFKKMADFGLLAMRIGPGEHLKLAPKGLPMGLQPEEFDYFYEQICHEELVRTTCPGFVDGAGSGMVSLSVVFRRHLSDINQIGDWVTSIAPPRYRLHEECGCRSSTTW